MNIATMLLVVLAIDNAMICEACLPDLGVDLQFLLRTKGKSALDELQSLLQWDLRVRSEQQVKMIGHDDEFVELEAVLFRILCEAVNQQTCHAIGL